MLSHFSHVHLCATPRAVALQAPLSMIFSRQEYWSGLPGPQGVAISNNTASTWTHFCLKKKKKKGIDPEIILAPGCLTGLQGIKGTEEQMKVHYKAASIPVQNVGHPAR